MDKVPWRGSCVRSASTAPFRFASFLAATSACADGAAEGSDAVRYAAVSLREGKSSSSRSRRLDPLPRARVGPNHSKSLIHTSCNTTHTRCRSTTWTTMRIRSTRWGNAYVRNGLKSAQCRFNAHHGSFSLSSPGDFRAPTTRQRPSVLESLQDV